MNYIYIDHAATTPLASPVNEVMYEHSKTVFGNPSSIHGFGREARKYVDQARKTIAASIYARETEVIFTSGGTEAINSALIGVALANKELGSHIITSNQEHQATLNAMQYLETKGFEVSYVDTDQTGRIDVNHVTREIKAETILISLIMVNNETGVIQPIDEIGMICVKENIYFHTDAIQAFGPILIDVGKLKVDLLTISAHKVNGPKGIGALYVKEGTRIEPIQFGGDQERKRRPGTENVVGIIGFEQAVKDLSKTRTITQENNFACRQAFLTELQVHEVEYNINGDSSHCVDGIINLSFPGTQIESMLMNLDIEHIAASSGSACTAGTVEPSHVIKSMFGEDSAEVTNSIRFSFGKGNTTDEMKEAGRRIAEITRRIKN